LDGQIVHLFTQFLTAADFNSDAVVLMMKKITTVIIKESKPLNSEIVKLLVRCVRRENQGGDVLKNCAAKLKPYLPDRMVNEFHNFVGETIPSKDTTRKRKLDCLEGSSNMVHRTRRSQDAIRLMGANKVNNSLGGTISTTSTHEKRLCAFDEIRMRSQPVTELGQSPPKMVPTLQSDKVFVQGNAAMYKVKNSIAAILKSHFHKTRRIQTSNVATILSEFKEIERQVLDAEATNINVSWILAHMEAIQKRNEAMKKSTLLKEMKANTILVKRAAQIDLRERGTKLEAAQNLFEEAERYYQEVVTYLNSRNKDTRYHQEVVTFFDGRNKRHKLSYDNGDEALLHLEREQWELVSDCLEPAVAINVSSPQPGITCVHGYKVTNINAPILEAIFKKHGDIASDCVFKTASVRESILEVVCDVVRKIQTNDVKTIISEMDEIDRQVSGAEVNKINVSWLRAHLESIHKRNDALKKYSAHIKMKENTSLVTRAAKIDLDQKRIELLSAQQRSEEADRCVKVLHLVEQKLNDDILESKAEGNKWAIQPII
ncbi:phospholipase-like protein, partial [Tanacetum coccineum]